MYSRIIIFGRQGSGKSTFAHKLAQKTGLPLHHLDKYYYTHNWIPRNFQEFCTIQQEMVSKDTWIIEGNCFKSLEIRYPRAELVLYFNYSRLTCLARIIKRRFTKDAMIQDRAPGCYEKISWKLIERMLRFETRKNRQALKSIEAMKAAYPQVKFIEVRSDKELAEIMRLFR